MGNLHQYEAPYYTLQEMSDSRGLNNTGVNPAMVSGEDVRALGPCVESSTEVMDAGIITFTGGSMFDARRTWHFKRLALNDEV